MSVVQALRGEMKWRNASAYAITQIVGCCVGTLLAHGMFGLPLLQTSTHVRAGFAEWLSEAVATGGPVLVVIGNRRASDAPWIVAAWIGAAYWFTASTSFANPGDFRCPLAQRYVRRYRPTDVPGLVLAQFAGALLGLGLSRLLFGSSERQAENIQPVSGASETVV